MQLSIITINLNNAEGLRKTMESVFSQTSCDFEYIVVDGNSTDGSKEIILDFAQKYDRESFPFRFTWISEPDKGIYHAMNKGIQIARGEYCQFLNSGDWLVSSVTTSSMLSDLPTGSIIYGNMLKHFSNGKILKNKRINVNSYFTFYTGSLNHASAYIKTSLFEKYGLYDESLRIVSDWKFYLITIAIHNESVAYRDIDVAYFELGGISSSNDTLEKIERKKVLKELMPSNLLNDFDQYAPFIIQMKRINRYRISRWVVKFIERILFKIEKLETILKGEHILY